jgi:hypothetical protein
MKEQAKRIGEQEALTALGLWTLLPKSSVKEARPKRRAD